MKLTPLLFLCMLLILGSCNNKKPTPGTYNGWSVYGGNKEGTRFSTLTQIDTSNVQQLTVAWTFNTGDADTAHHSQIQCNPIILNGVLYGTTPTQKIFAVDAATGKQKWMYNPLDNAGGNSGFFIMNNIRGICYWEKDKDKRLFFYSRFFLKCCGCCNWKAH